MKKHKRKKRAATIKFYYVSISREDVEETKHPFTATSDKSAKEIFAKDYLNNKNHKYDFLQLFRENIKYKNRDVYLDGNVH